METAMVCEREQKGIRQPVNSDIKAMYEYHKPSSLMHRTKQQITKNE